MIKKIYLNNFRCFENTEIIFHNKNLIYGNNGAGKTTIIESIYLCSNYRTLKAKTKNKDLIYKNRNYSEIQIESDHISNLKISQRLRKIISKTHYFFYLDIKKHN